MPRKQSVRGPSHDGKPNFGDVPERAIANLVQVFKLLGDETRLRILFHLRQNGELHVTDLCARLGQTQPAVSHHLTLLRIAGVIEARRGGKRNYYTVCLPFFSDLVRSTLASTGEVPRKYAFHDFALHYNGR